MRKTNAPTVKKVFANKISHLKQPEASFSWEPFRFVAPCIRLCFVEIRLLRQAGHLVLQAVGRAAHVEEGVADIVDVEIYDLLQLRQDSPRLMGHLKTPLCDVVSF